MDLDFNVSKKKSKWFLRVLVEKESYENINEYLRMNDWLEEVNMEI